MKKRWLLFRVLISLGLRNVARVIIYRSSLKFSLNSVTRIKGEFLEGDFFLRPSVGRTNLDCVSSWNRSALLFGHLEQSIGDEIPSWQKSVLTGVCGSHIDEDWWRIPDFDDALGDVKGVWELSRFNWVIAFSQRAREGSSTELDRLNLWLNDWCKNNPPYKGYNWKCAQEASIRVIHLALAAIILEQEKLATEQVLNCVKVHLERIAPTLDYAIAQDNNHGTSEAVALFVGGSWLAECGCKEGSVWSAIGRNCLESRVSRLINKTGGFSQYSLNYHRLMLDSLSIAEVWRSRLDLPKFSEKFTQRAAAASEWLRHMVDPVSGDGPNVGANDGANLLCLSTAEYRDFRPSVQLAYSLFAQKLAYSGEGSWNLPLEWLNIPLPDKPALDIGNYLSGQDGFLMLRKGEAFSLLRCPMFKFRPSQADALHLDLWVGGVNILRDSGSYTYYGAAGWMEYFNGTSSHNTIQFDNRDQMPRLGRFLFGAWIKKCKIEEIVAGDESFAIACEYEDHFGVQHKRHVKLQESKIEVTDTVSKFKESAILRWRLMPGSWVVESSGNLVKCSLSGLEVTISSDTEKLRGELVQGWESRYYNEKVALDELRVEIKKSSTLITIVRWGTDDSKLVVS